MGALAQRVDQAAKSILATGQHVFHVGIELVERFLHDAGDVLENQRREVRVLKGEACSLRDPGVAAPRTEKPGRRRREREGDRIVARRRHPAILTSLGLLRLGHDGSTSSQARLPSGRTVASWASKGG